MCYFHSGVQGSTTRGSNNSRQLEKSSRCIGVTGKVMMPVYIFTLGEFFMRVVLRGNAQPTSYNSTHSFLSFIF